MSDRKIQANPDLRFERYLLPAAADHLFQAYLLTEGNDGELKFNVTFANVLEKVIITTFVVKFSLSLWLGWDARNYQKFAGEFYAAFNSKPTWLYLNSAHIIFCIQDLVLSLILQNYFDKRWLEIFLAFSGAKSLSTLRFGDNRLLGKLLQQINYIFGLMAWIKGIIPFVVTLGFGGVFMWNLASLESFFLGFFWSMLFYVTASPFCARLFSTSAYFVSFCLYASRRLLGQAKTVRLVESVSARNAVRPRILSSMVKQTIVDQMHLISQIQSANRFYKHVAALYIPALTIVGLVLLYGFQKANNSVERMFLGFLLIIPLVLISFYFLTSAMVSRAVKRCYLSWAVLASRINQNRRMNGMMRVGVIITTYWHVLMMLEYLSSKKFKVGFSCLHWFALTTWSLVKLLAMSSSSYFFLVQFARSMQP